ncbi:hypothetical protein D915_005127 [Fasciola hepatica]|uniref:adenylate cyclase n=1 Tax=Fasciola hepatica TaxID=6192 RepID=A0A2H1CB53_FASHE|nr:hypothetical protein D915_005127 [Fasciola hepatica]
MSQDDDTFCGKKIRDIFQSNTYAEASIYSKFLIIFRTIAYVVNQELSTVGQFYEEVSIRHLVRRLRAGIRLTMIYSLIGITELGVLRGVVSVTRMALVLLTMIFCVIFYWATSRVTSPRPIFTASFLITLQNMAVYIMLAADDSEPHLAAFMSGVMLLVTLCLLLPIRYDVVVTMLTLYASAYLISSWLPAELSSERWLEHGYRTKSGRKIRTSLLVSTLVWFTALIGGIQLHLWSMLRQKTAFLFLADSVHEYNSCLYLGQRQNLILRELLPKFLLSNMTVRDRLFQSGSSERDTFIELIPEDNVSLLRAELEGLWEFVDWQVGVERIRLLHRIFVIFDQLSARIGCEKLDVCGNSYLAFCGLDRDKDERLKLCIELGLVMCYMIKRLAHEYGTPVNLRVGVHSASAVFIALMGSVRPRFDMFSDDMIALEQLQSTGLPGRVHVADTTYERCRDLFHFAPGGPIELMKSDGRVQLLDTYYVHPRSKSIIDWRLTSSDVEFALRQSIHNLDRILGRGSNKATDVHAELDQRLHFVNTEKKIRNSWPESRGSSSVHSDIKMDRKLSEPTEYELNQLTVQYLAINIQEAPKKFRDRYRMLPINLQTMRFIESNVEKEYQSPMSTTVDRFAPDSNNMIAITDMISLTIHFSLVMLTSYLIIRPMKTNLVRFIFLCVCFSCPQLLTLFLLIQTTMAPSSLEEQTQSKMKHIHNILLKNNVREFLLFSQTLTPTLFLVFCLFSLFPHGIRDESAQLLLISLEPLVYMTHLLATRSRLLFRVTSVLVSVITFISCSVQIHFMLAIPCYKEDSSSGDLETYRNLPVRSLEMWAVLSMVWTGCRENDLICRLLFYHRRIRKEQHENRVRMTEEIRTLICCIIPERLYDRLTDISSTDMIPFGGIEPYWTENRNTGVAVIAVINFRSTTFAMGANTEHVSRQIDKLNQLMGLFDQLLSGSAFLELDKIKSWQHYYMVCSGLFLPQQQNANTDLRAHLVALMEYCLLVLHQLTAFNEQHFPDSHGFQLAIGYHTGSVLAGLAGYHRVAFNVWGHAVNLAQILIKPQKEKMINQIIVHEITTAILSHRYEFQAFDQRILNTGYPEVIYTCQAKEYP